VRHKRILLTNQHARQLIMFGMKGSSHLCSKITEGVENAGLCGLGVDSVNSNSDYFAYLCIPVETNCKNEPCLLDHMATRRDYCCFIGSKLQLRLMFTSGPCHLTSP
jgi:hypothetical protein